MVDKQENTCISTGAQLYQERLKLSILLSTSVQDVAVTDITQNRVYTCPTSSPMPSRNAKKS